MREVEVRVLGPVELRVDGLIAPVERVQVRRMLAVLAISAGTAVSTDRLIDELWPGELPKSPRAAVRVVASRLRTVLGSRASVLRSNAHEYVLGIDQRAVDAHVFDALVSPGAGVSGAEELARLDAASELWRGDPFGGAQGPPSLDRARARLDELHLAAAVRRAELQVELGRPDRAAATVVPLITDETADERLWAVGAVALARTGRRAEALAVIRRARHVLVDVHGLVPSIALASAERTVMASGAPAPVVETAPVPPTLFGRDGELADAVRFLVADGATPPVVLISGDPGTGKSALAAAVLARRGVPYVYARCDPDLADIEALTAVLAVDVSAPRSGDGRSRTIKVVDDLVAAIGVRAADGPLLLILDDLQWAGEIELRFVLRLVRTAPLRQIGVVATMRTPDGSDPATGAAELLAKIEGHGRVCHIELGGLDRAASRRAFASWRGGIALPPADTTVLMELTGGNPYLIRSVAAAGLDLATVPADAVRRVFRDAVADRLTALPAADADVLRTAAVLGRTIDAEIVAAVSGRTDLQVAGSIDRGIGAHLLVLDGGAVRFDHELTRLGLAGDVGPAATAVLHAAATDACRRLGRDPVEVARHLLGAGSLRAGEHVGRDLLAGADRAAAAGRFDEAVRFLGTAARLEPDLARRLDVQRQLAWAMECAGDRDGAVARYDEIFGAARQAGMRAIFGRAALGGASFGAVVGGDAVRLARLHEALGDPPPDERLHLEIAAAAVAELDAADQPVPSALLELVRDLAVDDDAAAVRRLVDLRVIRRLPVTAEVLADVEELVGVARRTGDIPVVLEAEEMLVRARLERGDLDGTERARADLERTVQQHRWPRYVWTVALFETVLTDLRLGPDAAEEPARRALGIGREHGVRDAINAYSIFRLSVARRDGTLGALEPWIRMAIDGPSSVPAWHAVLAASLAEQGDAAGAMAELERFWDATGDRLPAFTHIGLALAAHAGRLVGDAATVRVCIDRLLPWSGNLLVAGAGAGCFGPADLVLADAMEVIGDARAATLRRA